MGSATPQVNKIALIKVTKQQCDIFTLWHIQWKWNWPDTLSHILLNIYMFESHTKNLRSAPALIDHVTTRSSLKKLALKSSRLGALLFFKENNTDLISYSTTSLTKELRTRFKFQLFI